MFKIQFASHFIGPFIKETCVQNFFFFNNFYAMVFFTEDVLVGYWDSWIDPLILFIFSYLYHLVLPSGKLSISKPSPELF